MNIPEVTMHDSGSGNRFQALDKALRAADIALSIVRCVPSHLRPLANQVVRSASSVPANLAEGNGRVGRDRLHHFRIALGSAREVDTHLRLLLSGRSVNRCQAEEALQLFDDVRGMTWRLLHPRTIDP
jgi:four helix bundle protein